jgi:hypothetical protein
MLSAPASICQLKKAGVRRIGRRAEAQNHALLRRKEHKNTLIYLD